MAAEYEASGLGREEFCHQRDVPRKTLTRYLARYRKPNAADIGPSAGSR